MRQLAPGAHQRRCDENISSRMPPWSRVSRIAMKAEDKGRPTRLPEGSPGRRGRTSMLGLMQDWPLLCPRIIDPAALNHAERKVITRSVEGPLQTTNYAQLRARALKVAQRLDKDGVKLGDRVATLAWNTSRHLEAWFGILGIGAIYHTINPRLFADQITWIVNHAEDRVMMVDRANAENAKP